MSILHYDFEFFYHFLDYWIFIYLKKRVRVLQDHNKKFYSFRNMRITDGFENYCSAFAYNVLLQYRIVLKN